MKQCITIKAPNLGTFTIKSDSNYSAQNKNEIDNISLVNVPITYKNDNKIPIIYSKNNEFSNICLLEEINYEVEFVTKNPNLNAFYSLLKFKNNSPLTLVNFDNQVKGYMQFSSYVGKTYLDIYKEDKCVFKIPIEVRSRKLNYNNHYPLMIGDLSKYSSGIIFELSSPLYQSFDSSDTTNQSPYELFMILEYIFQEDNLPSVVEYLSRNLYSTLENYTEEVPSSFASNITPDDLLDSFTDHENLYKPNGSYIPLRINETKYIDTIDVAENRFYKHFLLILYNMINDLSNKITEGYASDKLSKYKKEINYYLSQKYFSEISKMDYIPLNSQVLQKKEGYRDILSYYLMLEFGFKLNWSELTNKFKGNEKKIYQLYEYWCYFELLQILESITDTKINFEDLFMISKDSMSVALREGVIKSFIYKDIQIDLAYNKSFNRGNPHFKSYSVNLRPDYTLAIHFKDETYFIHFDAKYKMFIDSESFKNQDVVKMHAYKDALKNTVGAYVVYPGSIQKIYYENDNEIESVGAFPLTPGENRNREQISKFIISLIEKVIK